MGVYSKQNIVPGDELKWREILNLMTVCYMNLGDYINAKQCFKKWKKSCIIETEIAEHFERNIESMQKKKSKKVSLRERVKCSNPLCSTIEKTIKAFQKCS